METLVVTMAADPAPITTLHPVRNQNDGENAASRDATAMSATPSRNIFFLP